MKSGACDDCLLASTTLGLVGGHLERSSPASRPGRVLSLRPGDLVDALGGGRRRELRSRIDRFDPDQERRRIRSLSIRSACRHGGDFGWPDELESDPEPPWVLNALGEVGLLSQGIPRIAVVGARRADQYGRESARRIGRASAGAGAVVVSGLALGVDAAAHKGALECEQGMTIAVVGGGVDVPYPRTNAALHRQITQRGLVISEMPPGTGVWRWSFPARNRLIAALSRLVAVVQADHGSGSLHTAEAALARGVQVAAVPGRIDSPLSAGVNRLIADGAVVVGDPSVVPEIVGCRPQSLRRAPAGLQRPFQLVERGEVEPVLDTGGVEAAQLALDLAKLELAGLIERTAGGRWRPTDAAA